MSSERKRRLNSRFSSEDFAADNDDVFKCSAKVCRPTQCMFVTVLLSTYAMTMFLSDFVATKVLSQQAKTKNSELFNSLS